MLLYQLSRALDEIRSTQIKNIYIYIYNYLERFVISLNFPCLTLFTVLFAVCLWLLRG